LLKTKSNKTDSISDKLHTTFPVVLSSEAMSAVLSWRWVNDLSFQSIVRRALYIFRINGQLSEATELLMHVISKNETAALVSMKAFQSIWKLQHEDYDSLLYQFYSNVVKSSTATAVRTMGLECLSDLLDGYENLRLLEVSQDVLETGKLFYSGSRSPELSMAWVKFSGNQAYITLLSNSVPNEAVKNWGMAILNCLEDEKVSTTRYEMSYNHLLT
jgi:hypothetical protein